MSAFNVTLCCLNSKYIHSSLAPWCIFTSARKRCCEDISLTVLEGTINENEGVILGRLLASEPDVVSFSCYIWNITKVLSLSARLKEVLPDVRIILGGPEVSYRQREILKEHSFIDFVVSGEGEITVPVLLNRLYSGNDTDIPAVSYRIADCIHIDRRSAQTDEEVSPYCEEYFRTLNGRIAYIESSRGCPFNCAFCLSGRLGKVRYIDIERVKCEMVKLSQMGAKTIKFVDRTFNCNKHRAEEILSFILSEHGKSIPCGTCFHFEIAADLLDDTLFEIVSKLPVGAVQFEVGIQSFNELTLNAINRKTDIDKVVTNVKRLISYENCHIHIDLIAGLPQEGYESFVDGFNRAYGIGADMLQLGFLKILPGSPMAENADKYPCIYKKEPPYEVVSTPYITAEELQRLHIAENELDRLYNSGRFSHTLAYVLSGGTVTPYELFYGLGVYLEKLNYKSSVPLDKYTNLVFEYLSSLEGVDKSKLRDEMIYDRIATNNSGVIPESLKVTDENMKKIRNLIKEADPSEKGTDRTVAILYTKNEAVYCDYKERNPITGRFEVKRFNIECL